jgi:hypothetical protein
LSSSKVEKGAVRIVEPMDFEKGKSITIDGGVKEQHTNDDVTVSLRRT